MKKFLFLSSLALTLILAGLPSAFAQDPPASPFFTAIAFAGFGEVPQELSIAGARETCAEYFPLFFADLCLDGKPVITANCPITPAPNGQGPGLMVFNPQDFCPEGFEWTCYIKTKDVFYCGD